MSIVVTVNCSGRKRFRVFAKQEGKANSYYADRLIDVDCKRTIFLSFPVSPKMLVLGCVNINNPNDKDFGVVVKEAGLKKYNIWMDKDTERFVQMAVNFSQVCGFRPVQKEGTLYSAPDLECTIRCFPTIKDVATGNVVSTPARIGHESGGIQVSAYKFAPYTIPARFCILCHEYSHKYKNPKIGLEISNEFGADINGLYIYLGLGFSKVDAICCFANVFLKAQTEQNMQRMRKIIDYIEKFENQQFAEIQQ